MPFWTSLRDKELIRETMVHSFSATVYRSPRDRRRFPQTNLALPSFTMIIFSTIIVFLGFLQMAESRQCESYRNCLGDYLNCCSGYCRRSCNQSCTRDEHCGSPGSLEEFCCKGKCISTSTPCAEKPVADTESVLSGPVIAIVVIFSVMLLVAVCFFFRSHLCKVRALCFGERAQQVDISKVHGTGFVALDRGSAGTLEDSSLTCTERISLQSSSTWVGQDFRIAPSTSSKIKRNGLV